MVKEGYLYSKHRLDLAIFRAIKYTLGYIISMKED